jgi:hypothetical protein
VGGDIDLNQSSTLTGLQKALQGSHKTGALDVVVTKLAVDLQTLSEETAETTISACLETLREAIDCDAVCIGLFDPDALTLERVFACRAAFSACNPEVIQGLLLDDLPWLGSHLDHLRLFSIADTTAPGPGQESDAEVFAGLHIGAVMLVGFDVRGHKAGFMAFFYGQPQVNWNVEHQTVHGISMRSITSCIIRLAGDRSWVLRRKRSSARRRTGKNSCIWMIWRGCR